MQENLISNPFLYSLALTLLHFIWQGALIALALKLLLIITSKQKAQLRYAYSCTAMLANLFVPIITFFVVFHPQILIVESSNNQPLFTSIVGSENVLTVSTWYNSLIEYLPSLSLIWMTSVCFLAFKLFIQIYNVNKLATQDVISPDEALEQRFYKLVQRLSLKRVPQLVISLQTEVPMAVGWIKPVVLIPFSMLTGLTPAQLDMLMLHELAHIRRHDYLVNFIQTWVEILLFFHPCVIWISKQMRNEREYCTDDLAVQHCGNAVAYAHTLADTATLCQSQRKHSIPAMAMAASGGDLKQRVIRLVEHNHHCTPTNDKGKWVASLTIIITVVLAASLQFVKLPYIDLSSGNISLQPPEPMKPINKMLDLKNKILPENSLAQQLLAQSKVDMPVVNNSDISAIQTAEKEQPAFNPMAPGKATVDTVVIAQKTKIQDVEVQQISITLPEKEDLSVVPSTVTKFEIAANPAIENKPVKSISDLAFERTNSNNRHSRLNNPYASQVASLNDDAVELLLNNDINQPRNRLSIPPANERIQQAIKITKIVEAPKAIAEETKPTLVYSVDPRYPATAKRKGIELEVKVNFTIDTQGKVKDINFQQKGKASYFRSAIRNAVEKWQFRPATVDGKAVDSQMAKIFSFSLVR